MIDKALAYEPSHLVVHVPSKLVCMDEGGAMFVLSKDRSLPAASVDRPGLAAMIASGLMRRAESEAVIGPALWAMADEGRLVPFPVAAEEAFRAARAEQLVRACSVAGTDPVRRIEGLTAAAALVGLDLATLVHRVKAGLMPGESLAQGYQRLKRT